MPYLTEFGSNSLLLCHGYVMPFDPSHRVVGHYRKEMSMTKFCVMCCSGLHHVCICFDSVTSSVSTIMKVLPDMV